MKLLQLFPSRDLILILVWACHNIRQTGSLGAKDFFTVSTLPIDMLDPLPLVFGKAIGVVFGNFFKRHIKI